MALELQELGDRLESLPEVSDAVAPRDGVRRVRDYRTALALAIRLLQEDCELRHRIVWSKDREAAHDRVETAWWYDTVEDLAQLLRQEVEELKDSPT